MLIAARLTNEGKNILVVGLEEENIRRLKNDEPILKNLDEVGLKGWDLMVLGPEDVARYVSTL